MTKPSRKSRELQDGGNEMVSGKVCIDVNLQYSAPMLVIVQGDPAPRTSRIEPPDRAAVLGLPVKL